MTIHGVAYKLWQRVQDEQLNRGWKKREMEEATGLSRGTLDRLKESKRPPQPPTVHAIADALGIPRREAEELAGLRAPSLPGGTNDDAVRRAITEAPYPPAKRDALLRLLDAWADRTDRGDSPEGANQTAG